VRAGFHAPLPPARSGVADYAATLLGALRKRGSVEVGAREADVHLYHIGNNRLHAAVYRRALKEPGVVVLHDALLQHLFFDLLDEEHYVEEFVYNYGAWHRDLARDLWRTRTGSGLREEYYRFPMLKRLVERSRAVVVHNPAAARIVQEHVPAARVVEIPHLFDAPPSPIERLRFRERLGILPGAFLFGVFGYLRESKRLVTVLRAFQAVRAAYPGAVLLVCGEFVSNDLPSAAAPLLAQPGVVRLGHLAAAGFWRMASAVDACVNLRYPAAGETSGITIRLMGLGKPVMVTACEETARFPEAACVKVEHGLGEQDMLARYMLWLCLFPGAARELGRRGAEHIRRHHALEQVAGQYWETLCASRC